MTARLDALAAVFFDKGWVAFDHDPEVAAWARAVRPLAGEALADPDLARWWRAGGTWFVGVHALANNDAGALPERGVPPLRGEPVAFVAHALGLDGFAWDRAQISVCLPGYPQRDDGESEAAHRFRLNRDAAHVDGLLRHGEGRRHLGETHGFVLGIPLAPAAPGEAPFVVYEGSHEVMRRAFDERLGAIDPAGWADEDITEAYVAARRHALANCPRVEVHVEPGQAYIAHRLSLHGVAPWRAPQGGSAPGAMRMIAYFRPDPFSGGARQWLDRP